MILLHMTQQLAIAIQHVALVPALPLHPQATCTSGSLDPSLNGLNNLITLVKNAVFYVAGTVFLISVAIAGIMRMTAYGNERRIAMSNMALTAAVVGLILMLMSPTLQTLLQKVC